MSASDADITRMTDMVSGCSFVTGMIEASFKKGVLTVTLPKKVEAQKPAKKIEVKAV
jgi:Hsp20/alpha crystallin family protein